MNNLFMNRQIIEEGYHLFLRRELDITEPSSDEIKVNIDRLHVSISHKNKEVLKTSCDCATYATISTCQHILALYFELVLMDKMPPVEGYSISRFKNLCHQDEAREIIDSYLNDLDAEQMKVLVYKLMSQSGKSYEKVLSEGMKVTKDIPKRFYSNKVEGLLGYINDEPDMDDYEFDEVLSEILEVLNELALTAHATNRTTILDEVRNISKAISEVDLYHNDYALDDLIDKLALVVMALLEKCNDDEKYDVFNWLLDQKETGYYDFICVEILCKGKFPKALYEQTLQLLDSAKDQVSEERYQLARVNIETFLGNNDDLARIVDKFDDNREVVDFYTNYLLAIDDIDQMISFLMENNHYLLLDEARLSTLATLLHEEGKTDQEIQLRKSILEGFNPSLDDYLKLKQIHVEGLMDWINENAKIRNDFKAQVFSYEKQEVCLTDLLLQLDEIKLFDIYAHDISRSYHGVIVKRIADKASIMMSFANKRSKYIDAIETIIVINRFLDEEGILPETIRTWRMLYSRKHAMMDELNKLGL